MEYDEVMDRLKSLSDPKAVEGMARFGINANNVYGVSIPNLRRIAKQIGKDHTLAQKLWDSGVHEARILAGMIDDPDQVTYEQMERWVSDFDSWDICDEVCLNLFDKNLLKSPDFLKSQLECIALSAINALGGGTDGDLQDPMVRALGQKAGVELTCPL